MENEKVINITNGTGSSELINGTYAVTSSTLGYDDTVITPNQLEITEGINSYNFTIAATGTLTLHVTEDGTSEGTPIVGAKFVRCDSLGTIYGSEGTSNSQGNVTFNYVPFGTGENIPIIYFKQTASDQSHVFNQELQNITLLTSTHTLEIRNQLAPTRNFTLTDTNYSGLPIPSSTITLS